jgi:hypothetical protein
MNLEDFVKANLDRELNEINATFRKKEIPELNIYEKALIFKYSEDGYRSVNKYLRSNDGKNPNDFAQFLSDALSKLPDYKSLCYRTADLSKKDLKIYENALKENKSVREPTFVSCSKSKNLACYFRPFNTLFIIYSKRGKEIEKIAKFGINSGQNEEEILFSANSKFIVLGIETASSGETTIMLEEK